MESQYNAKLEQLGRNLHYSSQLLQRLVLWSGNFQSTEKSVGFQVFNYWADLLQTLENPLDELLRNIKTGHSFEATDGVLLSILQNERRLFAIADEYVKETLSRLEQPVLLKQATPTSGKTDTIATWYRLFCFEEVSRIINEAQTKRLFKEESTDVLQYVSGNHYLIHLLQEKCSRILKQISHAIRLIVKALYSELPMYCGFRWICRIWFLLHGSHPPKEHKLALLSLYSGGAQA